MIVATLFDGLWQGAILIGLTYALSRLIARHSAATRSALWSVALIALIVVPIATTVSDAGAALVRAFASRSEHAAYTIALIPAGSYVAHARGWFEGAAPWMLLAWVLGAGFCAVRLAVSFVRVEQIRRRVEPLPSAEGVFTSDEVAVPIVAGIFDPVVVVPRHLQSTLSSADFRRVVEHERAHVRRRDPLWNLMASAIEAMLFFNPWVRIAAAALSTEREAACDDWVVARTGGAEEYAACLAALAQTLRDHQLPMLAASAYRSRHALVARIERLCRSGPRPITVNRYALGGTIVLFVAATLALQAFSPAIAFAPGAQAGAEVRANGAPVVAASCTNPDTEALVRNAAFPQLPHGLKTRGTVNVAVTIAPSGHVVSTKVVRSSGDATIDNAVVQAARNSTYSPKVANCSPVEGRYLFRVDFAPRP